MRWPTVTMQLLSSKLSSGLSLDFQMVVMDVGTRYDVQIGNETKVVKLQASSSRLCQDGCVQGEGWEGDRL